MSRWIRAIAGGLVLSLCLSLCGFEGRCDDLRGRVLRLHILANSDSEADQALKLKVRDAVVEASAGWLDGAENAEEAEAIVSERLPELTEVARQVVRQAGCDYPVTAERCEMYFTTRRYGSVTLPAGRYQAVRILIGEGAGHNWWCVLFPPLCVSAATDAATTADVLTREEDEIVNEPQRYAVKLKVVEWWEAVAHWFGG